MARKESSSQSNNNNHLNIDNNNISMHDLMQHLRSSSNEFFEEHSSSGSRSVELSKLRSLVKKLHNASTERNVEVHKEVLRQVDLLKKLPTIQPHLFDHLLSSRLLNSDEEKGFSSSNYAEGGNLSPQSARRSPLLTSFSSFNQGLYYENPVSKSSDNVSSKQDGNYLQQSELSPRLSRSESSLPTTTTPSTPTTSYYSPTTLPSTPSLSPLETSHNNIDNSPNSNLTPTPQNSPLVPMINLNLFPQTTQVTITPLSPPPSPSSNVRNWSQEFWTALSMPYNSPEESLQRSNAIRSVAESFVKVATRIGKQIINEAFLPPSSPLRTIQSIDLGGMAGGMKFLKDGIFFKFAVDQYGLYGGDQYASKAAGHELKGLMAFFNCQIPGLLLPLMALIDYQGFRLIATSSLPISEETLVYGSCNGGSSVHNKDPVLAQKMREAAQILNLKGHWVGGKTSVSGSSGTNSPSSPQKNKGKTTSDSSRSGRKFIYAPCDIEGHYIKGWGYVIVDTARTFPPEKPFGMKPGTHLHNLLRPELVRSNSLPLSSDAFTSFGGPDNEVHNREVEAAQQRLLCEIIPNFVLSLNQRIKCISKNLNFVQLYEEMSLTQSMHMEGINVRYLPLLKRTEIYGLDSRLCTLINTEIIARKAKNRLRAYLRARQAQVGNNIIEDEKSKGVNKVANVYSYLEPRLDNLNINEGNVATTTTSEIVSSSSHQSSDQVDTTTGLVEFLNLMIIAAELQACETDGVSVELLLYRLTEMIGIHLTSGVSQKIGKGGVLTTDDVVEIDPKVKYIHTVPFQEGIALYHMSLMGEGAEGRDPVDTDALLAVASGKFQQALNAKPDDPQILTYWGILLLQRAKLITGVLLNGPQNPRSLDLSSKENSSSEENEISKETENTHPPILDDEALRIRNLKAKRERFFELAVDKFSHAVHIKRNHHYALYNWGDALRVWAECFPSSSRKYHNLTNLSKQKLQEAGVFDKKWFFGTLPTNGAQGLLSRQPALSFLIRNSNSRPGHFVFSYLTLDRKIKHSLINNTPDGQYTLHPPQIHIQSENATKSASNPNKGNDIIDFEQQIDKTNKRKEKLRVYPTLEDLVVDKILEGWTVITKEIQKIPEKKFASFH